MIFNMRRQRKAFRMELKLLLVPLTRNAPHCYKLYSLNPEGNCYFNSATKAQNKENREKKKKKKKKKKRSS
jgi:hypothetical protein